MEDDEAQGYLYSSREAAVKEQLWLAMNQEFVEKQEAKRLIQASTNKAWPSMSPRCIWERGALQQAHLGC